MEVYRKFGVQGAFLLMAGLVFGAGTCSNDLEQSPEFRSGPDQGRSGAKSVAIGATAVDNVDYVKGDRTDWKVFEIPAEGVVTITARFDNSDALAQMVVTDETGQVLSVYEDKKRHLLKNVTFKGGSGKYYMQIFCDAADTDYSILVEYNPI